MLNEEIEEQLQSMSQEIEELRAKVAALEERNGEPTLIPEAEYDLVPSAPEKVIARGIARFVGYREAPKDLGLSPSEWALISEDEDARE